MVAQQVRAYHTRVRAVLTNRADATARATHFVQRTSPLSGSLFVMSLIFTIFQDKKRSLNRYVDTFETLAAPQTLSVQAFDQRFNAAAVAMMRRLLAEALEQMVPMQETTRALLQGFTSVYIADSTLVPMPATLATIFAGWGGTASQAGAKALVLLEWFSGRIEQLQVHSGRTPDQGLGPGLLAQAKPGALWLFDLGFWKCGFLAQIARAHSWFLCRLQARVTVRECGKDTDREVDVDRWLRKQVGMTAIERPVVLGQKQARLECRLIAVAVPKVVADQRRRKLREKARNQGRTLQKSTLFRQGFTVFVTNASREMLPASAVTEMYRVRWQIELLFKVAKGEAGLATYTSRNVERVQCEFYAVLIALVLVTHLRSLMGGELDEVSLTRLWRRLRTRMLGWGCALRDRGGAAVLLAVLAGVARHVKPSKRDKHPSTRQRIERLDLKPAPIHPGLNVGSRPALAAIARP